MSDIFVSYDDQDRERVRRLVGALEARGWSVWWDHRLAAGEPFGQVIERELRAASCVVVAWSTNSVHSQWVRAEAEEGRKRNTLAPVFLDRVEPPMPFGQIQTVDLVDWRGKDEHPGFLRLVADLGGRIGRAPAPANTVSLARRRQSTALVAVGALVLVATALTWYALRSPDTSETPAGNLLEGATAASSVGQDESTDRSADGPARPAARVAGHWQAQVSYRDGASFEERFTCEVNGRELTGPASLRGYGNPRNVLSGVIDGDRLSFRTKGTVQASLFDQSVVTFLYRGTVQGDTIRFTVEDEESGNPPLAFTATRISAEQASKVATGGTRPSLSGMDLGKLYPIDHVRALVESRKSELDACYQAAEFDPVEHEFVSVSLTLTGAGAAEGFEMRPAVPSLSACLQRVLAEIEWGPTLTQAGGTMRLNLSARLPWNP